MNHGKTCCFRISSNIIQKTRDNSCWDLSSPILDFEEFKLRHESSSSQSLHVSFFRNRQSCLPRTIRYSNRLFPREILDLTISLVLVSRLSNTVEPSKDLHSLRACDFEVFGTVQGVYFRHHTQQQAKKLNLVGWVKNTEMDTVQGYMEGQTKQVEQMKSWLQTTGSPKSKITKAEFTNEKSITQLNDDSFSIKR